MARPSPGCAIWWCASVRIPILLSSGWWRGIKEPRGSRDVFIPWDKVKEIGPEGAELTTPALNLQHFARRNGEIVLRDALFDRQVVDVEGRRVVRINDLDLAPSDGQWRLVAVDVSLERTTAPWRRGWPWRAGSQGLRA